MRWSDHATRLAVAYLATGSTTSAAVVAELEAEGHERRTLACGLPVNHPASGEWFSLSDAIAVWRGEADRHAAPACAVCCRIMHEAMNGGVS